MARSCMISVKNVLTNSNFYCDVPLPKDSEKIPMSRLIEEIKRYYVREYGDDKFNVLATFAPDGVNRIQHRYVTVDEMDEFVDIRYIQTLVNCFFVLPLREGQTSVWK